MSLMETRGGIPYVLRETIDVTGRRVALPQFCKHLQIYAATFPVKVYFSAADYAADASYILVPVAAASTPNGLWEGPADLCEFWLKATVAGSSAVTVVAFLRRG